MGSSNGKFNGNGNGHDPDEDQDDSNVVRMPSLAERDRMRREKEKQEKLWRKQYRAENPGEPMINMPPVTKALIGIILAIHLFVSFALDMPTRYEVYDFFGFKPGLYTGRADFTLLPAIAGPLLYMFFHGSWLHIGMNTVMLMAFGTGAERWMGGKRMLILFYLCSLAAAVIQFILSPFSLNPMIGASGGLSGLFGAVLMMLYAQGRMGHSKYGILPFVALWIGISIIFGMMGGPDGSSIAWAAHIGGFLAGLALTKPVLKMRI